MRLDATWVWLKTDGGRRFRCDYVERREYGYLATGVTRVRLPSERTNARDGKRAMRVPCRVHRAAMSTCGGSNDADAGCVKHTPPPPMPSCSSMRPDVRRETNRSTMANIRAVMQTSPTVDIPLSSCTTYGVVMHLQALFLTWFAALSDLASDSAKGRTADRTSAVGRGSQLFGEWQMNMCAHQEDPSLSGRRRTKQKQGLPRSRTGLAHDENVLRDRGLSAHRSRFPLVAHALAPPSHVSRRVQSDVRRLLRQESSHPSARGAGCFGDAAWPCARRPSMTRRSTVHAIHAREPDRTHVSGAVHAYLLRISDQSRYFVLRNTPTRYFGGNLGTPGGVAEANRTPSFVDVEDASIGVGRQGRYGEVIRHPRGSQRPSCLHGLSSVLLFSAFRGYGFAETASEMPCTTQEPGIEIKTRIYRDRRGPFDAMPAKISNRGLVLLACRRSVDGKIARCWT